MIAADCHAIVMQANYGFTNMSYFIHANSYEAIVNHNYNTFNYVVLFTTNYIFKLMDLFVGELWCYC